MPYSYGNLLTLLSLCYLDWDVQTLTLNKVLEK